MENENLKECIECKSEIRKASNKCPQCQSFQNWRRYLDAPNTVLALLVALVAVLGTVVPALVYTFSTPNSDIRLGAEKLQTLEPTESGADFELSWVLTNVGDRPASLGEGRLSCRDEYAFSSMQLQIVDAPITIRGNDIVTVRMTGKLVFDDSEWLKTMQETPAENVDDTKPDFIVAEISVFNFDGTEKILSSNLGGELMNQLKDTIDRAKPVTITDASPSQSN